MACQITRNEVGEIERVLAPNGSPSQLFRDAKVLLGDKEKALDLWATAYTPSFLLKFGDWIIL